MQSLYGDSLNSSVEYVITDKNGQLLSKAELQFSEFKEVLSFKILDIERNPREQGFPFECYSIRLYISLP